MHTSTHTHSTRHVTHLQSVPHYSTSSAFRAHEPCVRARVSVTACQSVLCESVCVPDGLSHSFSEFLLWPYLTFSEDNLMSQSVEDTVRWHESRHWYRPQSSWGAQRFRLLNIFAGDQWRDLVTECSRRLKALPACIGRQFPGVKSFVCPHLDSPTLIFKIFIVMCTV